VLFGEPDSGDDDDLEHRLRAPSTAHDREGRGTTGRISDALLAARIGDALRCDPLVHGRHLEVMVQNRVAILIGELGSIDARTAAARRTWTVPGVRDVCNRLTVAPPGRESSGLA
jgi:osmotically-inducible protein OsmY